jgi:ISXO2-like transposase domain
VQRSPGDAKHRPATLLRRAGTYEGPSRVELYTLHTNTIEGSFSILKRGIIGSYHHVNPQDLKWYLAEFYFRYNERMTLGVFEEARATKAFRGTVGKRLMYKDSSPASISDQDN